MSRARTTYKELPPKSKKGCAVKDCKKYADYEAAYGKKDGLFRFVTYLCAFHKLMAESGASEAAEREEGE